MPSRRYSSINCLKSLKRALRASPLSLTMKPIPKLGVLAIWLLSGKGCVTFFQRSTSTTGQFSLKLVTNVPLTRILTLLCLPRVNFGLNHVHVKIKRGTQFSMCTMNVILGLLSPFPPAVSFIQHFCARKTPRPDLMASRTLLTNSEMGAR